MQEMRNHPQLPQVGRHEFGWTNYHEVVLRLMSTCFWGTWINYSLTKHVGGGLKLPFSWHIWPNLAINGLPLNKDLRKQFPTNGIMELALLLCQVGKSFGTSTKINGFSLVNHT